MPIQYNHDHDNEINFFGMTSFRNRQRKFGIKTDDRRRHMYVVGKTGMGKTTLLENMVVNDIVAGHGLAVVDPHGDAAEKLLDFIPSHRINDVIYCNPADHEFPVAFNVLESVNPLHKHLVAQGLMGVFKKIWPDVWSARMEHILNNCILALLDCPGSTLLGINRLLVDKTYRKNVINKVKDPIVKAFWVDEFQVWEARFRNEAIQPIQNKVGQFLSASIIRNIVAQVKSTINMREIMDQGKILIMNLAKGRLGEDTSRLLGGMLITKMQLATMERVDTPEEDRRDFYLYVDEFQNFATESFGNILSEARKYRLNLIIAHQYVGQLVTDVSTKVRDAVFGNVGTLVTFRIGAEDAEFMEKEFGPQFMATDLVQLPKYEIYLKLMIDGITSIPFSSVTLPPIAQFQGNREKVIKVSRERYSQPASAVEEKILRWAGATGGEVSEEGTRRFDARQARTTEEEGEPKVLPTTPAMARAFERASNEREQPPREKPKLEQTAPIVIAQPEAKPISLSEIGQRKVQPIKLSPRPERAPPTSGEPRPMGGRFVPPSGAAQPQRPQQPHHQRPPQSPPPQKPPRPPQPPPAPKSPDTQGGVLPQKIRIPWPGR